MKDSQAKSELIESLAFLMASGKIQPQEALPILQKLSDNQPGLNHILELLAGQKDPAFETIRTSLQHSRLQDAVKYHRQNTTGSLDIAYFKENLDGLPLNIPSGWHTANFHTDLEELSHLLRDHFYLEQAEPKVPKISAHLQKEYQTKFTEIFKSQYVWAGVDPEKLIEAAWDHVDDNTRQALREFKPQLKQLLHEYEMEALEEVSKLPDKLRINTHAASFKALKTYQPERDESLRRYMDLVFLWTNQDGTELLLKLWQSGQHRDRLELLLTMRFGSLKHSVFNNWNDYLQDANEKSSKDYTALKDLLKKHPLFLLYLWCLAHAGIPQSLTDILKEACLEQAAIFTAEAFTQRWSEQLLDDERNKLLGLDKIKETKKPEEIITESPSPVPQVAEVKTKEAPIVEQKALEPTEGITQEEIKPSIWEEHMKPFLSANWFMMAGVILFIVGSSILSYVTWDKHWIFRYTLMPTLLAAFTVGLSYLGRWIENKDKQFVGTATILRGAAIQLLPVNFMAVALLSSDEVVNLKHFIVPLMGGLYLVLARTGLKRWCRAVSPELSGPLSRTILLLNSLVILAPIATAFGLQNQQALFIILGSGFYLGFAILAHSVIHFSRSILTAQMSSERRIVWFFGATALGTYLQVFGWVHSHIQHLPQIHTYAPMFILTAALLLMLERRAIQLQKKSSDMEGESFLGYAIIIIGLLMGSGHESIRIICCLLAGTVWLFQAIQRRQEIHYYIAINLFVAGIFCIGFQSGFQGQYFAFLGVVNILLLNLAIKISRQKKLYIFAKACNGSQAAVLFMTVVIAMIAQLRHNSHPALTAVCMTFAAVMFIRKAYADDQLRWIHTAMFIFALTLPYVGCVNLEIGTLEGNTLIFGLSLLSAAWIATTHFVKFPLLKDARSTVLWFYGILAVTAMIIRVVMERHSAVDPLWYKAFMDYTGPMMMTAVLILTSFYSRSLIPAFMASIIAIILFPELKANFRATFDMVGFGSGLGSAGTSLVIVLLCFFLRKHPHFQNLGEGDKFMNKSYFPLRRYNYTLFTWPLTISICFLLIKTGTFNLLRQVITHGTVSLKEAIALIIGGFCSWLLCIYFRRQKGKLCFHPGWFYIGLGIHLLFLELSNTIHWVWPALCSVGVLQALHYFSNRYKKSHHWLEELFEIPAQKTLAFLSQLLGFLCICDLIIEKHSWQLYVISTFITGQYLWHALVSRKHRFAVQLYLLILAHTISGPLLTLQSVLTPIALLALSTFILHLIFEDKNKLYKKFRPLLKPALIMASLTTVVIAILTLPIIAQELRITVKQIILVSAVLLLAARAHVSRFFLLWASLLLYGVLHYEHIPSMLKPFHLSAWALTLALANHLLLVLQNLKPSLINGKNGIKYFKSTDSAWIFIPAISLAIIAEIMHLSSGWRNSSPQIISSYLAAATLAVSAWSWCQPILHFGSIFFVTLGNIHFIRINCGSYLKLNGLSDNHLICLGIGVTLLFCGLLKKISQITELKKKLTHASLTLSMAILVILIGNYVTHPNLQSISLLRFFISGAMSLMAGLYFRNAARYPQPGDENFKPRKLSRKIS